MRKYYLGVEITCDQCGDHSWLDKQTNTKDELEEHVKEYYLKNKNGEDICLNCFEEKEARDKK